MNIKKILTEKGANYPLYSQENKAIEKHIVFAKLFNTFGSGTWYITEYDPVEELAFGYVEGLVSDPICDEWGYISIAELADLYRFGNFPVIEVDLHFEARPFGEIDIRSK